MHLKTEDVVKFVGGQMEIQNQLSPYLYRGEIKTISVEKDELRVTFAWQAKGEGFPPLPKRWIKSDRLDYVTHINRYQLIDVGSDSEGCERLCLSSPFVFETLVLFLPNGSKLDRTNVVET